MLLLKAGPMKKYIQVAHVANKSSAYISYLTSSASADCCVLYADDQGLGGRRGCVRGL